MKLQKHPREDPWKQDAPEPDLELCERLGMLVCGGFLNCFILKDFQNTFFTLVRTCVECERGKNMNGMHFGIRL